jgi:hypothetical protein
LKSPFISDIVDCTRKVVSFLSSNKEMLTLSKGVLLAFFTGMLSFPSISFPKARKSTKVLLLNAYMSSQQVGFA